MRIAKKIAAVYLILAFAMESGEVAVKAASAMAAVGYKDVDAGRWAFEYIYYVSSRGLMFGDTQGYFKPREPIDIFSAYKTFARAAGFNLAGATSEETLYYSRAYEKNKTFISKLAKNLAAWDKSAEREIAYLLEREVVSEDDFLNNFSLTLTRERAAELTAKTFNKMDEAILFYSILKEEKYEDDFEISTAYRPYIYFLAANGVLARGSFFYPKRDITREALAALLYQAENCFGRVDLPGADLSGADSPGAAVVVLSASGTIDEFYPNSRVVVATSPDGERDAYLIAENCLITSGGFLKTVLDLKKGMKFQAVLNNASIVDMKITDMKITDMKIADVKITDDETGVLAQNSNIMEGEVKEIYISETVAKITVLMDGANKIYAADPADSYELRIGQKIGFLLDGGKIDKFFKLTGR
jgi:hypothetical protein